MSYYFMFYQNLYMQITVNGVFTCCWPVAIGHACWEPVPLLSWIIFKPHPIYSVFPYLVLESPNNYSNEKNRIPCVWQTTSDILPLVRRHLFVCKPCKANRKRLWKDMSLHAVHASKIIFSTLEDPSYKYCFLKNYYFLNIFIIFRIFFTRKILVKVNQFFSFFFHFYSVISIVSLNIF